MPGRFSVRKTKKRLKKTGPSGGSKLRKFYSKSKAEREAFIKSGGSILGNPSKSEIIKKLRRGIRGTVKLSRGRLIIKT